ncbi:LysM peptidoglycan-binding domain-containing protein [Desulfotruncus alcoholivorax]|uniref:LysM peptidoglycan-binding domain-containing protein n=1 Tax=Desulfotruncus alcoholivorax TaxID=265477 RepID=UPI0004141596|nr:LysM domain-containing protein [Desulfotruncus alcoholivorax]
MTDFENINVNDIEENNKTNKQIGWKIFACLSCLLAIASLAGVWYVNNQRLFLMIDNSKLKVEVQTLQEEVANLKNLDNDSTQNNTEAKSDSAEGKQSENKQTDKNYTIYEVKPGDSLTGISIAYYGTEIHASKIAELNGITPESILQLGQKLKIPKKP